MTDEASNNVKVGDLVLTKVGNKYRVMEVVNIVEPTATNSYSAYSVRRFHGYIVGEKRADRLGNPLMKLSRIAREIGPTSEAECRKDPETANVFADWLEENGHTKASKALRERFPLYIPKNEK